MKKIRGRDSPLKIRRARALERDGKDRADEQMIHQYRSKTFAQIIVNDHSGSQEAIMYTFSDQYTIG
jgi:hypothetical protein